LRASERTPTTTIFPSAWIKLFITASVEERAERRYKELMQKGYEAEIQDIRSQIEKRDYIDTTREDSPLIAAADAMIMDSTGKNIEEVLHEVISIIKLKGGGVDAV
jgi:cytidylate kinase